MSRIARGRPEHFSVGTEASSGSRKKMRQDVHRGSTSPIASGKAPRAAFFEVNSDHLLRFHVASNFCNR
jgi:hypothetical protein